MKVILLLFLLISVSGVIAVIPEPTNIKWATNQYALIQSNLLISYTNRPRCTTVTSALQRFGASLDKYHQVKGKDVVTNTTANLLSVYIAAFCDEVFSKQYPNQNMNEACECMNVYIPLVQIDDYPRFKHRGFLIDSSRHFLSVPVIKRFVDAMSMVKMNVLHWHIVDDQSFPYDSYTFPGMASMGAFQRFGKIYTQQDVAEVIEYARQRGVRVMSEFDTPGHTLSWGNSITGLLTKCYTGSELNGNFGPIDPTNEKNYNFIKSFFDEVKTVFPDDYIHLGGDEVPFNCWASNPDVKVFMQHMNITSYADLESYYIERLGKIVAQLKPTAVKVFWEEVFFNKAMASTDDVVHVWIDERNLMDKISQITSQKYRVLISAPWYLNYISYGDDWTKYYSFEPLNFNGTPEQKARILGGEACMWGEYVGDTNLISRSWSV
ncbi:hypothetical protein Ciccas_003279 [Cichlidogyrus casuarinus]|uniref:beta-N-acetylhexosaminidase n=1 Tax=Cichlidogyrus casuarinus TaxID=1844966 RepID=A0ABD2QF11_9PLAT